MTIRPAVQSDVLFLKRLLVQLGYPNQTEAAIQYKVRQYGQHSYRLLVADTDQEVVGFIALHWSETIHLPGCVGRITAFCVDERSRGQGIGNALIGAGEQYFTESGCCRIEVTCNHRRIATHQYYLNRGYVEDARRFVKAVENFSPRT